MDVHPLIELSLIIDFFYELASMFNLEGVEIPQYFCFITKYFACKIEARRTTKCTSTFFPLPRPYTSPLTNFAEADWTTDLHPVSLYGMGTVSG